ncbi:MAG: hypothetical protein GY817_07420, partial [bacterium]|nr:hypothetical protein [bacterium]
DKELIKRYNVLQKEIDGDDASRVKRNGSASVVAPLIDIMENIRNVSTNRSSVLQAKARALAGRGISVQSQKTEVVGSRSSTPRSTQRQGKPSSGKTIPVQEQVTFVSTTIICDLCHDKVHGETRNCLLLENYMGKHQQLPNHICPLHLGRKDDKCAGGKCGGYFDKRTGQHKSGLCLSKVPAVNFRVCGCADCEPRALANLRKQKSIQSKEPKQPKKTEAVPKLWPAPGVAKKGTYQDKGNAKKVEVRMIGLEVHQTSVESNYCTVNGAPLGQTLCPAEVLSIPNSSGQLLEVLVMYDSHSQCTFFDPALVEHCTNVRTTGPDTVAIKTFSGDSESLHRTIGELSLPVAGGLPIKIEGLVVEAQQKAYKNPPVLPSVLDTMRKNGILAKEPSPGVRYPAILLGADVRTSVFPVTVFELEGQEAVSFDGLSVLKSKLSSLYILTGALKHQEPANSVKEMSVPTEVNQHCVVAEVPEVSGEEPVHGDLHVEANKNCVITETPAAITKKSALPELSPAALAAVGARADLNRDLNR